MQRFVLIVAALGLGAAVLLRPSPPPVPGAGAWATPSAVAAGRGARPSPPSQALVYVTGEVARPGVYAVSAQARARDALRLAGGARPGADLVAVNLAAHVRDGDEIVVPPRGAAGEAATYGGGGRHRRPRAAGGTLRSGHARSHRPGRGGRAPRAAAAAPPSSVDINAADAAALATVPGIGPGLAQRIVAFRERNGAFTAVDELLDVAGITDRRLDTMLPYVVAR